MAQPTYQFRSSPLRELITERRAPEGMPTGGLLSRFPVTSTLLLVILVVYAIQGHLGAATDPAVQIRLGAVRQDLVFERHEYYRLLTAAFLHGGFLHLALNGLALFQLGILCELVYGRQRTLVTYLLSAIGGTLCSASFMVFPSVGASGAILGLAGLLLGTSWYGAEPWRQDLRVLLGRRLLYAVLLTFGLGLGIQLLWIPIIDNFGHLGGLATGMVIAALQRRPGAPVGGAMRALAVALVLATVGSFAWMTADGSRSATGTQDDMVDTQARLLREDPALVGTLAPELYEYYLTARLDAEAEAVAKAWAAAAPRDPAAQNGWAWFLLTRPRVELRDPRAAFEAVDPVIGPLEAAVRAAWGPGLDALATLAAVLDTRALALRGIGRTPEARHDEERAEGIWRRIVRERPDLEASVTPHLYQSYARAGDPRAWATLGRWLELTPNDPRAVIALADEVSASGAWPAEQARLLVVACLDAFGEAKAARSRLGRYQLAALEACLGRVLRRLGEDEAARRIEQRALGRLAPEQAPELRASLEAQLG